MNNTKFFEDLNISYLNNVFVRDPDWRFAHQNCVNRCKMIGYLDITDLSNYNGDYVKECIQNCNDVLKVNNTFDCKGKDVKQCCKQQARDDDTLYVKCLHDNNIHYDFKKEQHSSQNNKNNYTKSGRSTDDFVVINNRTFLPGATTFSCTDTVTGRCIEDVSLDDCIQYCDGSPFCDFGYHIQLKPNGKSYCLPLINSDMTKSHKNLIDTSIPQKEFELGKTYTSNIFYRKSLRYDVPNNISPPRYTPVLLEWNNKFMNSNLKFGSKQDAMLIYFVAFGITSNAIENNSKLLFNQYNSPNIITYDTEVKQFVFLPIYNSRQFEYASIDNARYTFVFNISNMSDPKSTTITNGCQVQFNDPYSKSYITVKENKLSIGDTPTTFIFNFQTQLVNDKPPVEDAYVYYQKFWKDVSKPPTVSKKIILVSVVVVVLLSLIVLLLWILR